MLLICDMSRSYGVLRIMLVVYQSWDSLTISLVGLSSDLELVLVRGCETYIALLSFTSLISVLSNFIGSFFKVRYNKSVVVLIFQFSKKNDYLLTEVGIYNLFRNQMIKGFHRLNKIEAPFHTKVYLFLKYNFSSRSQLCLLEEEKLIFGVFFAE